MRKEPWSAYDKRNITVVICDTDIPWSWWWPQNFRSNDINLRNRNTRFSRFLVSSHPLSRNYRREPQALWYRLNSEIFCWNVATYKCEVRNGKIVIISFVLNRPSLSMSRCMSRYEADLVVYVVFFISINQQCSCVWERFH